MTCVGYHYGGQDTGFAPGPGLIIRFPSEFNTEAHFHLDNSGQKPSTIPRTVKYPHEAGNIPPHMIKGTIVTKDDIRRRWATLIEQCKKVADDPSTRWNWSNVFSPNSIFHGNNNQVFAVFKGDIPPTD